MNHITVGCVRQRSKQAETSEKQPVKSSFGEDAVTALGLCMLCLMLLIPVSRDAETAGDAVPVMSTAVSSDRETLREIDEPASADSGGNSVFDYIGELFAHLIFGA